MAVQQAVILVSQLRQISPLRLMMQGSRDGVDGVLGLGLRRGLLLPMVDWDKIRQILLQLGVSVILTVDDSVVLGLVDVELLMLSCCILTSGVFTDHQRGLRNLQR